MQYKGYTARTEFDSEAGILYGEVEGVRDVITFEATSVDALRQAFQESVDDYLSMCGERGEEPDKPYSGRFLVRIDPQLHRELAVAAARQGNSLNAFVASALKDLLVQRAGASEAETPNLRTNAKARAQSSINTYRQEVAATIAEPKVLNAEWTRPRDSMTLRPSTTSPSQTPASNTPTRRQVA